MERHREVETWRHGDMATWRHADMERLRQGHGNIKRKTEAQVISLNLFTICSSCKRKSVVCPFVNEETNKTKRTSASMAQTAYVEEYTLYYILKIFFTLDKGYLRTAVFLCIVLHRSCENRLETKFQLSFSLTGTARTDTDYCRTGQNSSW
jgi:hypothetical protein